MTADVDLLIVGGGFAGLAAAKAAAARGLSVRVVDAKPQIGSRLHTTGIFVKEAADLLDLPPELVNRVTGVRLYGPSRKPVDLAAPGYYFATTDTGAVLRWMAQEAERAGADVRVNARFDGAVVDGETVVARIGGETMRAHWMFGADGAKSPVAKAFGLGENTRFLTGAEREYEGFGSLDPSLLHCVLDSRTAPGYLGWAAAAPGFVQVGLAVAHGRKPDIAGLCAEMEERFGLNPDAIVERRAGVIPSGGLVTPWARPHVTLIGDAAGWVSPATGGGIRLALELGRRAGQAIADHQQIGAPAPDAQLAPELPKFWKKQLLRNLLDAAPANALIDLMLDTPMFRAFARRIYFHRPATPRPFRSGGGDSSATSISRGA